MTTNIPAPEIHYGLTDHPWLVRGSSGDGPGATYRQVCVLFDPTTGRPTEVQAPEVESLMAAGWLAHAPWRNGEDITAAGAWLRLRAGQLDIDDVGIRAQRRATVWSRFASLEPVAPRKDRPVELPDSWRGPAPNLCEVTNHDAELGRDAATVVCTLAQLARWTAARIDEAIDNDELSAAGRRTAAVARIMEAVDALGAVDNLATIDRIDSAAADITRRYAGLADEIPTADAGRAVLLLTALLSFGVKDRKAEIDRAVRESDVDVLAALGYAPPMVQRALAYDHDEVLSAWRRSANPELVAERAIADQLTAIRGQIATMIVDGQAVIDAARADGVVPRADAYEWPGHEVDRVFGAGDGWLDWELQDV